MGSARPPGQEKRQILPLLRRTLSWFDFYTTVKTNCCILQLHPYIAMRVAIIFNTGGILAAAWVTGQNDSR